MIFKAMELPVYLMTIDEVDEGVSYVAFPKGNHPQDGAEVF